jgi:hypothetical protein
MIDEEIVEIRRIRHQISAQFEHDPRKVVAYYRTLEKEYRESGELRFAPISEPPSFPMLGRTPIAK